MKIKKRNIETGGLKRRLLFFALLLLAASPARAYYQAEQGRWLNRDPIGESGGVHLYVNSLNNPINRIDPFGLSSGKCSYTIRVGHFTDRNRRDHGYDRVGNESHSSFFFQDGMPENRTCYVGCGMNDLNNGPIGGDDWHDTLLNPERELTNGHEAVYDVVGGMDAKEDEVLGDLCAQKDENGCPSCKTAKVKYDCDPGVDDFRCSTSAEVSISCGDD